jgi:hypothetical protein
MSGRTLSYNFKTVTDESESDDNVVLSQPQVETSGASDTSGARESAAPPGPSPSPAKLVARFRSAGQYEGDSCLEPCAFFDTQSVAESCNEEGPLTRSFSEAV